MHNDKRIIKKTGKTNTSTYPVNPEVNSLTADYLKSMQEISARYAKSLEKQVLSGQRNAVGNHTDFFAINKEILHVRSKNDLLLAVYKNLHSHFSCSGFVISLIDENGNSHTPYLLKVEGTFEVQEQFNALESQEFSIKDGLFDQVVNSKAPILFDVGGLYKDHKFLSYVECWNSIGLDAVVGLPLNNEDGAIGCLFVFFEKKYTKGLRLNLLISLNEQISTALSNVVAIENIRKSDRERFALLELGTIISSLSSRRELLRILKHRMKDFFSFPNFMIGLLIPEQDEYEVFIHTGIIPNENGSSKDNFTSHPSFKDGIFDLAIKGRSNVYKIDKLIRSLNNVPSYFQRAQESGAREMAIIPFKESDVVLGFVLLFFEREIFFYKPNNNIIEFLASQLSLAVSRILAAEKAEVREREREILFSLNNELALIRSAEELARVITNKLSRIFKTKNYSIFTFNKEKRFWQHLVNDPKQSQRGNKPSERYSERNYGINDDLLNAVQDSDSYYTYDVDKGQNWDTLPETMPYWKSLGIDKAIGFSLRVRGESIGVIFIEMESTVSLESLNFSLIKDIVSQISIAAANIIENEGVVKREEEKLKLLTFSERIAAARDKIGLSLLVKPYLTIVFGIKEFIITLIGNDQITYSYFLHGLQSEEQVDLGQNFRGYSEIPDKGSLIEQVMLSDEPVIFDSKQLSRSSAFWAYVGAERVMGVRLKVGNRDIGILWIQPGQITDFLLKGICSQIAVAVANVLTNEEIVKKEKERDALLSLNTALATVRNGQDLQKIINSRLKQFLHCSHALIGKVNEDKISAMAYLLDPESKSKHSPEYREALSHQFEINDGLMNRAAISSSPVAFNLQEIVQAGNAPLYVQINHQNGLKGLIITRLLSGNQLFGFWMIFFEEEIINKDKLGLIESLANQISIALTHITTNENAQKREEEKTSLLEFSTAIASVREREMFAGILKAHLKKLFDIKDYIIYGLSENKQSYSPLLFQSDHIYASQPEFRKQVTLEMDINDGVFDITLASNVPVIHDIEEISVREIVPSYIEVAKRYKLKKIVGVSLRIGQENIAVMNFQLDDNNIVHLHGNMFKSICSLLAIAVENIIAKEKVIKQFLEIDNYKQQLEEEQIYLKEELQTNQNYGEIIGESQEIRETFRLITQVAPSDSTVLILGETGTGKELIARAIHNNSPRRNKLMVKVNCAALPANLIESELFGHERGSFTGAIERRIGKFELANNGTLFLDEIGEMPVELQVKLLRAIQEKEIERIGGKGVIKVNVRIIAATNRDLEKEMEEGRFRSDLFYRLNIFPIILSPLRERPEDIPLLAKHFINRYSKKTGKKINVLSNKMLFELTKYSWPGNVRELEHLLERSVLLAQGETLKQVYLPREKMNDAGQIVSGDVVIKTIDENERDHIIQMLKYCNGRIAGPAGAANLLGVPPSTLNSKIKKLGIRREYLT